MELDAGKFFHDIPQQDLDVRLVKGEIVVPTLGAKLTRGQGHQDFPLLVLDVEGGHRQSYLGKALGDSQRLEGAEGFTIKVHGAGSWPNLDITLHPDGGQTCAPQQGQRSDSYRPSPDHYHVDVDVSHLAPSSSVRIVSNKK